MELTLRREAFAGVEYTPGELLINDIHFCWTLEDVVREVVGQPVESWKVYGKTAIPAGKYNVVLVQSPRFKRLMLSVQGVPGFSGILIHNGKSEEDTEGCPLVHFQRNARRSFDNYERAAMLELEMRVFKAQQNKEGTTIEVLNPMMGVA